MNGYSITKIDSSHGELYVRKAINGISYYKDSLGKILHREDGPASIIYGLGEFYYLNGVYVGQFESLEKFKEHMLLNSFA